MNVKRLLLALIRISRAQHSQHAAHERRLREIETIEREAVHELGEDFGLIRDTNNANTNIDDTDDDLDDMREAIRVKFRKDGHD